MAVSQVVAPGGMAPVFRGRMSSLGEAPGGNHILGRTGMCRSNGSLFYKKSLNMGPVFYVFYPKNP